MWSTGQKQGFADFAPTQSVLVPKRKAAVGEWLVRQIAKRKETDLPFQNRRPRHALTPGQRRGEIVAILSAALARMPLAAPESHVPGSRGSS